jgi:phospholipase/carboxylesterase
MTLTGPELSPRSGHPPRQLVLILHGYGADGEDLIGLGQHWAEFFPDALFFAPNAPTRCAQNPFGYEWFPIDFDHMIQSVAQGVPMAAPAVLDGVGAVWSRTGLGPAETIFVGFSQGAMMALHAGLSLADPPLGIVAFSGALVPPPGFGAESPAKPPVCLIHGDLDQVVDPKLTEDAAVLLQARGYPVSVHVSRGMAHGIAPDGLDFATSFMRGRLGTATA